MFRSTHPHRARRGSALTVVLCFLVVTSTLIGGVGSLATSHNQRATLDAPYASALDVAEAGINYELRKISSDSQNADQYPGTAYSMGTGSFTVYCSDRQGNGNWAPPKDLYITSVGTVNGISRTVKASINGTIGANRYATYGVHLVDLNGGIVVNGNVGTNGTIDKSNISAITGSTELNGPNAMLIGPSLNVVHNPKPVFWKTVSQLALDMYPNSGATAPGGLAYLQTHNNNAAVGLPADGSLATITNSITLVGPGDYYVTGITLTGINQIRFNNTNGPIRLWVGPDGGAGQVKLAGTTDATVTASNQVDVYVATTGGVDLVGISTMSANIYAYNRDANGVEYGTVVNSGNPVVVGSVVGYDVNLNGNATVVFKQNVNPTGAVSYYGYDNSWAEMNPR